MASQKWILKYMIMSFAFCIIIISINYYLDSYSIFKDKYSRVLREPNQNFIKMDFLINKQHSFDSFIFGSSRIGHINPLGIKTGNYYNMTYSQGLPYEHLSNIKLLIEKEKEIKNILIGLDDFSYQVNPLIHKQQPMRKLHYQTDKNLTSKIKFYLDYLLRRPSFNDVSSLYQQLILNKTYPTFNYDIYKTGLPLVPLEIDKNIENNIDKHINDKKFMISNHYTGNRIKETITTIREIVDLSKKYNFNLTIFINPIHKTTYLGTSFNNFQTFKNELAKLTNYYDFSGLNSITTNNYYYYETSHYRDVVGELIKKRLFDSNYDKSFGVYVSQNNIDEHLRNLKKQIQNYDLGKTLKIQVPP
jgi:hypothetical protein